MIELECKALVPSDKVEGIKSQLVEIGKGCKYNRQTNHYFEGNRSGLVRLAVLVSPYISKENFERIRYFASTDLPFSVRTRVDDVTGYELVIKHGTNAHNGMNREELSMTFMPYELDNPQLPCWSTCYSDIHSERLDTLVLCAGFDYLSKWSRERYLVETEEFNYCLDKNSGYGWLLEVEKLIDGVDPDNEVVRGLLNSLTEEVGRLGLVPLDPPLLEKMFEYYNKNWIRFYGKDKTIWEDQEFQAILNKDAELVA